MSELHPTILIGLDGATFTVLDSLVTEGHMPSLKRFMEEGVRAELLSTGHPLTPPAWTTVMTGMSPGNHGIFDFIWAEERKENVYFTLNNFRDIQAETVWSMVSRQGGRVTSLNFPFMSPPPRIEGAVVPGLVSWKHLRRNIHPRELYGKLSSLPGFSPSEVAWDFEREKRATKTIPEGEYEDWVRFHVRREGQWFRIFHHLQSESPADLAAVLLDGTDKLQHVCWRQLDPGIARESEFDERVRSLCLSFFRQLDDFIGEVLRVSPDSRIFFASDHGFGPTESVFRVNRWLAERGYLSWKPTEHLDEKEREKVDKLINGHFVHLDWEKTTAYAPSSATNGIHIRVARRPGETGIPPEQYQSFRDRLVDELLALRDPTDGTAIVTAVLKREEAFPGRHNQRCPDLTLVLHDYGFVSTLNQDPVIFRRPEVAGTHRPQGIFLARGPGIEKGERLPPQSILDVAPTILYSLGLAIPNDFEGSVIEAAFEPSHLRTNAVRSGEPTRRPQTYAADGGTPRPPRELDDVEDEAVIADRLRALGYVE
jgi:predicted AlkP superfamily phosphohydrolase/phosphomutase